MKGDIWYQKMDVFDNFYQVTEFIFQVMKFKFILVQSLKV